MASARRGVRVVRGHEVPTYPRRLELMLTDGEWEMVQADAVEVGISEADLISLVVAYTFRSRIAHAAALALHDILPWSRARPDLDD